MAGSRAGDGTLHRVLGPYRLARYATVGALFTIVAFVWLSLYMPVASVSFRQTEAGAVGITASDGVFEVTKDGVVRFGGGASALQVPAARLASADAAGSAERRELARRLEQRPMQGRATDAQGRPRTFLMQARSAQLSDLSPIYWQGVICGAASMLFGLAIWIIRPRDWAAGAFAWVGVWLFASAAADALVELWTVATPGRLVTFTLLLNGATLHLFALSFVALFARFPGELIGRRRLAQAMSVAGAAAAASVALIPFRGVGASTALQAAEYLALLGLVATQAWVGRRDPARRPTLLILAATITLGIVLYLLVTILPNLNGVYAPAGEAVAFPLFCLIYAGIGVSIVRGSLFAPDAWSRTIMLSICASLIVLLLDLALLRWLTRQEDVALGAAIAIVALAYLPLREWMARRRERRREAQMQQSLRLATDLAFARAPDERAQRWRAAVEATFRPLELATDPQPVATPLVDAHGAVLRLPSVAGAPALICRHVDGGRRLFAQADVDMALALIGIVERLVEARDAYLQGAAEERRRIARDLHDEVSGRLLTSLYRQDVAAMRDDVRDAMADIRTIATGLGDDVRRLGEVLADLRHECSTRCEAARIALEWQPGRELDDVRAIDYAAYRHLTALMRESVSNIIRHAGAASARIEVSLSEERLCVIISDDGRGISGEARQGRGLGNCAQRARALGGRFEVLSMERGGAVRFEVRLRETAEASAAE